MARLFFAIILPADVAERIEAQKNALRAALPGDGVRFVDRAQSHMTMRFLGEQSDEQRAAAIRAARRAAGVVGRFDVVLEGLGWFPDERRPHTLWAGTGRGASKLVALARALET